MIERFIQTLSESASGYDIMLSQQTINRLGEYYAILNRWNDRLHLVAPCEPEEFATRHVLESLVLLRFLSSSSTVIDVGSGAGLPIIPCLVAMPGLSATMVESSQKKSVFLRETLNQLRIADRATIIAKPFEETESGNAAFVTCRALDQFVNKVPSLLQWAPVQSTLLLFGGEKLRQKLESAGRRYTEYLLPNSDRRFLFEVKGRQ